MEWKSGFQTITAEEARRLLVEGSTQPRLSLRRVLRIIKILESGAWAPGDFEHHPIILQPSGKVRNGHHRLTAIAMVGEPVLVLIDVR